MSHYHALQHVTASQYIIPWLARHGMAEWHEKWVLDLGCGDGGVAQAFADAGASVVAVDSGLFDWPDGENPVYCWGELRHHILTHEDLVVLRDVIEHVAGQAGVLAQVADILLDAGRIFVSFPPYYSPYGAHQQSELLGWWRFLPWLHWHPRLRHIRRTRMTCAGFEGLVRECGLRIVAREFYLVRPFVAVRYGLPVVKLPRWLPKELCCGGAWYLLESA